MTISKEDKKLIDKTLKKTGGEVMEPAPSAVKPLTQPVGNGQEIARVEPSAGNVCNDQIVKPMVSPAVAKKLWTQYEELKKAIISPDDVQRIGDKDFLKKSYWRKIATFFNLSVEIIEERVERIKDDDGKVVNKAFHFLAKATSPIGRYAVGSGSCDIMEKGRRNTIHNTRSTAETRAFNRAISNLVGGGEVSAEEVEK